MSVKRGGVSHFPAHLFYNENKENVIEHDLAVIESFKQIGISKETIIRYYKVELELETKFIDYVLLTYSAKENKIIEYKERIKKSITY